MCVCQRRTWFSWPLEYVSACTHMLVRCFALWHVLCTPLCVHCHYRSAAGKGRPGSVIPTQLIRAASKAGSVASHASYPKTPALSQAGESVTSSVIASRLHRLEQVCAAQGMHGAGPARSRP